MTRLANQEYFLLVQHATGYNLGPVTPPSADGASLFLTGSILKQLSLAVELQEAVTLGLFDPFKLIATLIKV